MYTTTAHVGTEHFNWHFRKQPSYLSHHPSHNTKGKWFYQ